MDTDLKETFSSIAESLLQNEEKIMYELNTPQGRMMNIEGYFSPNPELATEAMRPSETFNKIIASI